MAMPQSTRSPSPHITQFPRSPIASLRETRPHIYRRISRRRQHIKDYIALHKEDGKLVAIDPAYYRNILSFRLIRQLRWDGPFCSKVFAEELRDCSGNRYTVNNGRRNYEDADGNGYQKVFRTKIDLGNLDIRLEIAALERARGEKLRKRFVPQPKHDDEGCWGQYVPARPTLPAKPPASPVKIKAKVPPKLRMRRRMLSRRKETWADMKRENDGKEDEGDSDPPECSVDGCVLS